MNSMIQIKQSSDHCSHDAVGRRTNSREILLDREWLVTNGLGGYASGTVSGAITRRYHGLLIAALPAPLGPHGDVESRFRDFCASAKTMSFR